jgi:hypothetical protein
MIMQNITEINVGRLKSKTDFSLGIEFDLTKYPTYIPVIEVKFQDPQINDYGIVVTGFTNDYFGERFTTSIDHFFIVKEMVNGTFIWTRVEDEFIDKDVFPNLRSLITDNELFIDTLTGGFLSKSDSELYENDLDKEIKDADGNSFEPKKYEQKKRTDVIPYYDYMSKSSTGVAIFNSITSDLVNRLNEFKV